MPQTTNKHVIKIRKNKKKTDLGFGVLDYSFEIVKDRDVGSGTGVESC